MESVPVMVSGRRLQYITLEEEPPMSPWAGLKAGVQSAILLAFRLALTLSLRLALAVTVKV